MMENFLYPTGSIQSTYVGFDSNALCLSPAIDKPYFKPELVKDSFKCERSDTGWYSPICSVWYQLQEENPEKYTVGDLY